MIGYCLTLMDDEAMWAMERLAKTFQDRLESHKRVFLAFSVLSSLTDDEYAAVIERMAGEDAKDDPPSPDALRQAAIEYRRDRDRRAK